MYPEEHIWIVRTCVLFASLQIVFCRSLCFVAEYHLASPLEASIQRAA